MNTFKVVKYIFKFTALTFLMLVFLAILLIILLKPEKISLTDLLNENFTTNLIIAIERKKWKQELSFHRLLDEGQQAYETPDYIIALKKWEQGLNIARQAVVIHPDKRQQAVGLFLIRISMIYKTLGNYSKALEYSQQALAIYQLATMFPTRNKQAIFIFNNIGIMHENSGNYLKALEHYQQTLSISRKIGNKREEGNSLCNIGIVYKKLRQHQKALNYQQQALKIKQKIGDKHGEAYSLANIGVVYKHLGKYQKAKKFFQNSLAMFEKLGIEDSWKALYNLASIEAKLNQLEPAIQHYEQALDNIEKLRAGITTKEHKTSFMRDKIGVYDELIILLQSQHSKQPNKGYDRKAIEIFERKQGRVFLEEMGQSGVRRFVGLDDEIITEEQSLMLKWQQLEIQAFTPQKYTALEQAEKQLKERIKIEYPKYYALKYPQPVDLATLNFFFKLMPTAYKWFSFDHVVIFIVSKSHNFTFLIIFLRNSIQHTFFIKICV